MEHDHVCIVTLQIMKRCKSCGSCWGPRRAHPTLNTPAAGGGISDTLCTPEPSASVHSNWNAASLFVCMLTGFERSNGAASAHSLLPMHMLAAGHAVRRCARRHLSMQVGCQLVRRAARLLPLLQKSAVGMGSCLLARSAGDRTGELPVARASRAAGALVGGDASCW